jgi:hypothetical protein
MSQFSKLDAEVKELKNGTSVYISNYKVRNNNDDQFDVMQAIQQFATDKSHGMAKHPNFRDKVINMAVEFANGTWASCAFVRAGSDFDISDNDDDLYERGKIKSFKLSFFSKPKAI